MLILGDLNAPEVSWHDEAAPDGSFGAALVNFMHTKSLLQHVSQPTRWRPGHSASTLDLVFTKFRNDITGLMITAPLGKSDHGVVEFKFNLAGVTPPDKFRRDFRNIDTDLLTQTAGSMRWPMPEANSTVDSIWSAVRDNLNQLTERFAPLRKLRRKGCPPWWRSKVRKAIMRKRAMWARFRSTGGHLRFLQYDSARKRAIRIQSECQRAYEINLARNAKVNPKSYYNYVQSRASTRVAVGSIQTSTGEPAESDVDKANALRLHFEKVHIVDSGRPQSLDGLKCAIPMGGGEIIRTEVLSAIQPLNVTKAAGPDGIHPAILKPLAGIITTPFQYVSVSLPYLG